jgi:hypothetical protein
LRLNDIGSDNITDCLPPSAMQTAFERIRLVQRKSDIIGDLNNGNYVLLRPHSSAKCIEKIGQQLANTLLAEPLSPLFPNSKLKMRVQVCSVRSLSSPNYLAFYPPQEE